MSDSILAIIILIIAIIMFASERIPLAVTSLIAALAMSLSGILTFQEAFSGMSGTVTIMIIGTGIIGEAYFTTGLSQMIGRFLMRFMIHGEKWFIMALFILGGVLSAFMSAMIIMAIFIPIIDCVVSKSEGKISRKQTYLPLAIAVVFGSNITIIGSTSMFNAAELAALSPQMRGMTFFEPALIGLPGFLIGVIIYLIFGYRWQKRYFDFEEPIVEAESGCKKETQSGIKKKIVIIVSLMCIAGFIAGLDIGEVSILGALILIITGCIDSKTAFTRVSWETVFVIVGTQGLAKGIEVSGAGLMLAEQFLDIFLQIGASPYAVCVLMLVIGTLLSNVMSNNATVAILVPISIAIAMQLHMAPMPYVLACAVGTNLAVATPVCVAPITYTTIAGYRFKDYIRIGGLCNLAAVAVTAIALKLVYFM